MGLKPKYQNEVTMTFRISNDFGERKAIRKVSDKMISISAYKTFGYDNRSRYKNPLLNVEITIFINAAKNATETDFTSEHFPKPGDYIDVTGQLVTRTYTSKDGKKHNGFRINATRVKFSDMEEVDDSAYEDSASIWQ